MEEKNVIFEVTKIGTAVNTKWHVFVDNEFIGKIDFENSLTKKISKGKHTVQYKVGVQKTKILDINVEDEDIIVECVWDGTVRDFYVVGEDDNEDIEYDEDDEDEEYDEEQLAEQKKEYIKDELLPRLKDWGVDFRTTTINTSTKINYIGYFTKSKTYAGLRFILGEFENGENSLFCEVVIGGRSAKVGTLTGKDSDEDFKKIIKTMEDEIGLPDEEKETVEVFKKFKNYTRSKERQEAYDLNREYETDKEKRDFAIQIKASLEANDILMAEKGITNEKDLFKYLDEHEEEKEAIVSEISRLEIQIADEHQKRMEISKKYEDDARKRAQTKQRTNTIIRRFCLSIWLIVQFIMATGDNLFVIALITMIATAGAINMSKKQTLAERLIFQCANILPVLMAFMNGLTNGAGWRFCIFICNYSNRSNCN